ncbi:MAG: DUF2568 domain-containing protein [Bacteroidetes bacterium]|nr:MAG: DUF2568 domain-containing protein [Bacteroidota bacterium]
MNAHPINLAVRFLLELVGMISMGMWGWRQGDGLLRFLLAFGIPVIVAAMWAIFNVADDPGRSGSAPVPVPGTIRLLLELLFFSFAIWTWYDMDYGRICLVVAVIVILHYIVSYDRIWWLIKH